MPNARESPPLETRYLEPRRPAEVVIERLKTPLLEAPPPLDPADRVENERTRQLRRRLGDAAYERVYAICRRAHERCTAVRKRDLFEVVAQGDYDACLAVEQLVFADIVRSTSSRQRAATLE